MPYQINKYNGDTLVNLADGALDSSTSLGLVGRNFAGYGEIQNENFLFLLENFAGDGAPKRPITGQLWYNTQTKRINVYSGTRWSIVGNTEVTDTAPTDVAPGDGWLDTRDNKFYVNDGTNWKFVGPEAVAGFSGATRLVSTKVRDTTGTYYPIIKATLNDAVIAIIADRDFTINSVDTIAGFTDLKKGVTLSTSSYIKGDVIGNATSATKLATARTINGVAFDGTANITLTANNGSNVLTPGQYITGTPYNGSTSITWTIDATKNNVDNTIVARDSAGNFSAGTITADLHGDTTGTHYGAVVGNTAGTHNGAVIGNVTGNLTGNVTGNVTGDLNGVLGNVTANAANITEITISDQFVTNGSAGSVGQILKSRGAHQAPEWGSPIVDLVNQVDNILAVPHGGTGRSSLTFNNILVGNGAGEVKYIPPGAAGTVIRSTGAEWRAEPFGITSQISYFASPVAPDGWLKCDGSAYSRVTYAGLFAAIGTTWGAGDGSTTFNVPDLRGEFIRVWDDAKGIDVGRVFGTLQAADVGSHQHNYDDLYGLQDDNGSAVYDRNGNRLYKYSGWGDDGDNDSGGPAWFYSKTAAAGGTETRPRNVALLACIKY